MKIKKIKVLKFLNLIIFKFCILNFGLIYSNLIPILTFHEINYGPSKCSTTPENFEKYLSQLYKLNYKTAKLSDVLANKENFKNQKIVILRFDDATQDHFNYIEDKNKNLVVDPKCAVGILLGFYQMHPDFGKNAIFFMNARNEFGQPNLVKKKIEFLMEQDMEIGNHGFYHDFLKNYTIKDIDQNFGQSMAYWTDILGNSAKKINIIATPYGSRPKNKQVEERLKAFAWNNKTYKTLGILYTYETFLDLENFDQFNLPSFNATNSTFKKIIKKLK